MYLEYSVPATVNERKVWLWLYLLKLCDQYLKKDFNVISKPQTSYKTQAFLYVNKRGANLKNEVTSSPTDDDEATIETDNDKYNNKDIKYKIFIAMTQ